MDKMPNTQRTSASEQLARPLPELLRFQTAGNETTSANDDIISLSVLKAWPYFYQEVQEAVQRLDPEVLVAECGSGQGGAREDVVVANEHDIVGRFIQNVGVLMTEIFKVLADKGETEFLAFAGFPAAGRFQSRHVRESIPDHLIISRTGRNRDRPVTMAVAEFTTPWTSTFPCITQGVDGLAPLRGLFAQVIRHMEAYECRFSFISNYESTIFLKRTSDYTFDVSPTIAYDQTAPTTLRQCFYYFLRNITNENHTYISTADVNILLNGNVPDEDDLVKARSVENLEPKSKGPATADSALFKTLVGVGDLTARSVILQPDDSPFVRGVNLGKLLSPPRQRKSGARAECGHSGMHKSVYRAKTFTGANLILKYFPPDLECNYQREVAAYEALKGCSVIPEYLGSGLVQLSSILTTNGFCILMEEVPGVTLTVEKLKEMGQTGRDALRGKLEEAYSEIRKKGFVCFDPRPENVILDEVTGRVTIVDLEVCIEDTAYEGYEVEQVLREPWPGFFDEGDSTEY